LNTDKAWITNKTGLLDQRLDHLVYSYSNSDETDARISSHDWGTSVISLW